jgi:hypothetical protein
LSRGKSEDGRPGDDGEEQSSTSEQENP